MKYLSARAVLFAIGLAMAGGGRAEAADPATDGAIYDPDPRHEWNRLNETLFARQAQDGKKYGLDELDILYWAGTTNLLAGSSHRRALEALDQFIQSHGESLVDDPLKRALLQRDLWELFDWAAKFDRNPETRAARRDLETRLAVAIHRLALSTNEVAALPDNYVATAVAGLPDLPQGLFQTNGDWIAVHNDQDETTTPTHVMAFDGHSSFCVMLHVPGGREASLAYLGRLNSFARTNHLWLYQTNSAAAGFTNEPAENLELNPNIPCFPTNTEWALVRRMMVVGADGGIWPTRMVESIQIRHYWGFEPQYNLSTNDHGAVEAEFVPPQRFYEFEMDRRHDGELREIGERETGFNSVHFFGKGIDPFEQPFAGSDGEREKPDSTSFKSAVLTTCRGCHAQRGIFSVNSYTRFLSFSMSPERPAAFVAADTDRETGGAIAWKKRQFDWGLLLGLSNQVR